MQIYVYLGSQINMVIPNDFLWINMTVNGVHGVTCFCQVCRQQKVDQLLGADLTNLQLYKHAVQYQIPHGKTPTIDLISFRSFDVGDVEEITINCTTWNDILS